MLIKIVESDQRRGTVEREHSLLAMLSCVIIFVVPTVLMPIAQIALLHRIFLSLGRSLASSSADHRRRDEVSRSTNESKAARENSGKSQCLA